VRFVFVATRYESKISRKYEYMSEGWPKCKDFLSRVLEMS
jgi:hypothetical protein